MWTTRVAEFIVSADTGGASTAVADLAWRPIADTIGCMVAGLSSPAGQSVLSYASLSAASEFASIWNAPLSAEQSALVAGTLGASMDFDDVSATGHPSSILIAAILAGAESTLTGADLLDAYLVGYEVTTRLGQTMMLPHTRHGWHGTSTAGYFGAAAAVARLRHLDVHTTTNAIAMAASMAAGIGKNFGTMVKPVHSGLAARGGVTAVVLAQAGITGGQDILDGPRGYIDMYAQGKGEPERLAALGAPWAMAERAPSLKKFPACYASHRAIDAMLDIQTRHDIAADDVEAIIVRAPVRGASGLRYPRPENGFEAKFSGTYPVAAAFLDREVTIGSFKDDQVVRPVVRRLIERIDLEEDARCRPDDPTGEFANPIEGGFWEVTVTTRGGDAFTATSAEAPGSPTRQLGWDEIREKFVDCALAAGYGLGPARALFASLRDLPAIKDVKALLGELRSRDLAPAAPSGNEESSCQT